MSRKSVRYTIHFLTAVSITVMGLFVIYGMQNGLFTDRAKMELLIERGGIFLTVIFYLYSDGTSCHSDHSRRDFLRGGRNLF